MLLLQRGHSSGLFLDDKITAFILISSINFAKSRPDTLRTSVLAIGRSEPCWRHRTVVVCRLHSGTKKLLEKFAGLEECPYLCTRNQGNGTLTEWLGSGLQNRVQQFESAGYL